MNYTKEIEKNKKVTFTVEVDAEQWQKANNDAYIKNKSKFKAEGFRQGKVPKKVIENMYGAGVFFEDAMDIVLPAVLMEILEAETEIVAVDRPDVNILAVSDATFKFTAAFTLKPEVVLGEYSGIELAKISYEVKPEDIDSEIEKKRETASGIQKIEDRPCMDGDITVIDFVGTKDGVAFAGGTAEKQTLTLGSGTFIPGFEEQVVGMQIGDVKDICVKFPDEYGSDELAGKDAVFKVTLHEIKVKTLPELNDDFASDVSTSANTLEELKAEIKADLEKQNSEKADREMEDAVMERITSNCKVEIPDCMIERQLDDMVREFSYRLQYQNMNIEDYYKYTGSTEQQLRDSRRDSAKKSVLYRLVMEKLAEVLNINPSDEELDGKLAVYAESAKKSLDEYKKSMSAEQIDYLKSQLITDKILEYVIANNKFI